MNKLLEWMKKNPRMSFGGIILVMVIIAIIWWVVSKKEIDGPKVQWLPSDKVYHPNKSRKNTVEEYRIEYADGDTKLTGQALATNIDIVVKWNNKGGFDAAGVTGIKFSRELIKDGTTKTVAVDVTSDNENHRTDFTENNEYTLLGTNLLDGYKDVEAIGKHRITMYYTKDNGDNTNKKWIEIPGAFDIDITAKDLKYTVNLDTIETITYNPGGIKDNNIEKKITEDQLYEIQDVDGNTLMKVKLRVSGQNIEILNATNGEVLQVGSGGTWVTKTGNITYKFVKYMTDTYFLEEMTSSSIVSDTPTKKYITFKLNDDSTQLWGKIDTSSIFSDAAILKSAIFKIFAIPPPPFDKYEKKVDIDRPGGAIKIGGEQIDIETCLKQCEDNDLCIGVNYMDDGGFCWTKKAGAGLEKTVHGIDWYKKKNLNLAVPVYNNIENMASAAYTGILYTDQGVIDATGSVEKRIKVANREECRALAKEYGHPGFLYRENNDANDRDWSNVCSGLTVSDLQGDPYTDYNNDNIHFSGCVDPSKTLENCIPNQ